MTIYGNNGNTKSAFVSNSDVLIAFASLTKIIGGLKTAWFDIIETMIFFIEKNC